MQMDQIVYGFQMLPKSNSIEKQIAFSCRQKSIVIELYSFETYCKEEMNSKEEMNKKI